MWVLPQEPSSCQEQAAASLALGASGCLFAKLAASSLEQLVVIMQLQRKFLAGRACAGPGCTLAAWLQGTMELETSRGLLEEEQDGGEGRPKERALSGVGRDCAPDSQDPHSRSQLPGTGSGKTFKAVPGESYI